MTRTEEMQQASRECAEMIKKVLNDHGKTPNDYDVGYLLGKLDGKEKDENTTRTDE